MTSLGPAAALPCRVPASPRAAYEFTCSVRPTEAP